MKNRTVRQRFTGLSTVALAACLGVGMLAAPSRAAEPRPSTPAAVTTTAAAGKAVAPGAPEPGGPAAQALTAPVQDPGHIGGTALKPADRAPQTASKDALKRDYDDPRATAPSHPAPSMRAKARSAAKAAGIAPAAACSVADFTSRTGSALVQQIKSSTTACVNTLFTVKGNDGYLAFREAQMVTVANALRDGSAAYPGDSSTGMPQLVLFLRAGYYVQYYDPATVGDYGDALRTAIQGGLDAFFGSAHAYDVTDANGETLSEAVVLIDSAVQNARYLNVVKRLLADYDSSYDSSWYMLNAVNSVYTVTFRGHQVPEFVSAVQADPSLLDSLAGFARDHLGLLGTDRSYLTSNAGRELGRFLQEESLRPKARPLVIDLLGRTSLTGPTAPLWVGLAEMTDYYDRANCTAYNTCDLAARIKSAVLPVAYTCSDSIRILAQQMSSSDLSAACTSLKGQDAYFHGIARDSGPVANDRNTTIEVVVFDSSTDYQTYAGAIYGIDTNNGGMYLEGDPAVAGNQPRFIAYEAEWVRPDFQIWNLNHEYTHYLDGRFNMSGDFEDGLTTPTIWWVEGFAEYVSYSYRDVTYDDAVTQAAAHTYTLRSLFDTTYENADQTRIYNWGYLAVRYMLQSHRADVDTLLGRYRGGDWNGARTLLTSTIGSRYDADWNSWLTACAAGSCGTTTNPPTEPTAECTGSDVRELGEDCARSGRQATRGNYSYLYLYVPAGTTRLTITTSGGTGDADLYYNANGWATTGAYTSRSTGSGNAHTLTVDNPAAGANYISLYAVQDFGGVKISTQY
ncbi:M9 family metallopeptidase [Streptomyces sp. P01-B04]|uniref:M9 family metallopeptidase n=1 Tax=Streptomyces poriferorum TaxID=2798799 RepID=UPI001C5ED492|nr:M9 family metallopeptidase [Streptomyces poriferorum]MBW5247845.1 M9 family metallopeptidase [Streptomyces poriferorum]MBW5255951.1 M9 family metallopeptidase [Streptomyces poriferorum]